MKLAVPRSPEWQGEIAVSRTSVRFHDAKDTLADRPDLIAELERQLLAAGMLASRERPSLWERLKAFTGASRSSVR
jgi:hypothetical protein